MSVLITTDFESETITSPGTAPTGAGDSGGGSWSVQPTTPTDSCYVDNDPFSQRGKVLHLDGSIGFNNDIRNFAYYTLASPATTGNISLNFHMMRADTGPGENAYALFRNGSTEVGGLCLMNDGKVHIAPHEGTPLLYTKAGFSSSQGKQYTAGTYHLYRMEINIDLSCYCIWMDDELLGFDDDGSWQSQIPFTVTGSQITNLYFAVTTTLDPKHIFVDSINAVSSTYEETAPQRITFLTGFSLDQASVTTYKDETAPNQADSSLDGSNVLKDSLNRIWKSQDVGPGNHRLRFDFGEDAEKTLRVLCIASHNIKDSAGVDTGNITNIRLLGGNSAATLWTVPEVYVDLTSQKFKDPMVAWLPAHDPCRYYGLEIVVGGSGLSRIDHFEVGRIIGHTSYTTPSIGCDIDYRWRTIDPSVASGTDDGTRLFRLKDPYRILEIAWRSLPMEDQEVLLSLFNTSGIHSPWLFLLDPASHPQDRTIYGYMDDSDLSFRRAFQERGRVSVAIREIVT